MIRLFVTAGVGTLLTRQSLTRRLRPPCPALSVYAPTAPPADTGGDAAAGATPAPPRRRRKEARPDELIDAALQLFSEKGFAATRSEEVARRAGVSKGTLYLYYPSKEELLRAVIEQRLSAEITSVATRVRQHPGSAAAVLLELLPAWWRRIYDSPTSAVFKLVVTEVRNFPEIATFYASEVAEPGKQLVGELIARGVREGDFRPVDVPHTVLSLLLPMVMLCLHKHSLGACLPPEALPDPHQFMQRHVELVVEGLRVRADA